MKTLIFYFLLITLPFQTFGQEMVKVNMVALADKVPAPPADVKAAYLRLVCTEVNMAQQCSADKFYQPATDELSAVKLQLEQLNMALAMPVSSGMQDMNPEEIQTRLASMSPEEQMQFAMQMSEQMGYGARALQPEPDEVIAAIEEHSQLGGQISAELMNPGEKFQKRMSLAMQRENKHQEINAWFKTEYERLPQVSFGEAGRGPDPQAEYASKVASLEKHIAIENEYLQALQQFWPEYREHLKSQYIPFQQKLAAINYGEDVLNPEYKRILAGGQGLLLTPAENLLAFSREVTETAANWWLQKQELERQKPKN